MAAADKYALLQLLKIPVAAIDPDKFSPTSEGKEPTGTVQATLATVFRRIDEETEAGGLNKALKAAKEMMDSNAISQAEFAEVSDRVAARRKQIS